MTTTEPLNCGTDRNWVDISTESFRRYLYPDGSTLQIDGPTEVWVTDTGSHRVRTSEGRVYWVKPGFNGIVFDGEVVA